MMRSGHLPTTRLMAALLGTCLVAAAQSDAEASALSRKGADVRTDGSVDRGELSAMGNALSEFITPSRHRAGSGRQNNRLKSLLSHRQQHPPVLGTAKRAGDSAAALEIRWNGHNATPTFIDISEIGPSAKALRPADPIEETYRFIETHRSLFRLGDPRSELTPIASFSDVEVEFPRFGGHPRSLGKRRMLPCRSPMPRIRPNSASRWSSW